ncbi:MAG TPA: hypothetical protein VHB01_02455 [Nitrosospira sp.]|nr:hypothetical protein [Nitrosospira sp.]
MTNQHDKDPKKRREKSRPGNSWMNAENQPAQEERGNERMLTQPVQLNNPYPGRESKERADDQMMMPHERDETTRRHATGKGNENEKSPEVIDQAKKDTEAGLKDTDRRGIPSDIVASENPASDTPEKEREKKR